MKNNNKVSANSVLLTFIIGVVILVLEKILLEINW
jgi:hypothetical protein